MEPAISVPCAICPMPAATAAPAPPDEPPGVMPESRGFLVSPWIRLVVNQRYENAGQLVRPRITAPALRRLSTTALIDGLTASSRASAADAASFAETFLDLIRAAISAADRRQRSSIANSV